MTRTAALTILIVVELGSVAYTAISLHEALIATVNGSSSDAMLVPLFTAVAMLAVYGVLTWEAFRARRDD